MDVFSPSFENLEIKNDLSKNHQNINKVVWFYDYESKSFNFPLEKHYLRSSLVSITHPG